MKCPFLLNKSCIYNFVDYISVMEQYPNIAECDPRQCIASRIMKCQRIISGIFRTHLAPHGITNSQLSILFILAKRGEATQQFLAGRLFLEKSTVSRNMNRLMSNTYVQKQGKTTIRLTDAGMKFLDQVIPAWEKAMQEAKCKLTAEGDEALSVLLNQLTQPNL